MTKVLNSLLKDQNSESVQISSSFVTVDSSGTPKTSPFTLTGGVDTITVPTNAVEFIVNPSANMKISEIVGMTHYDVVAANTKEAIECSRMDFIYIQGSGTVNFRFNLV